MHTFETQVYALGVYFQVEVMFQFDGGDASTNVPPTVDIIAIWLLGCYPEGCESAAVKRNDYVAVRECADIGYLRQSELDDLESRCWKHLEQQRDVAPDAAYE